MSLGSRWDLAGIPGQPGIPSLSRGCNPHEATGTPRRWGRCGQWDWYGDHADAAMTARPQATAYRWPRRPATFARPTTVPAGTRDETAVSASSSPAGPPTTTRVA